MASSVNGVMAREVPGYGLGRGELWRHAVAVSVISENLSKGLDLPVPEETFTAALLHDVGKLVLGGMVHADLARIEGALARGVSFENAEREVLGLDHAEAGAEILERWSIPEGLVSAVRWHHAPDRSPGHDVMLGIGTGREGLVPRS